MKQHTILFFSGAAIGQKGGIDRAVEQALDVPVLISYSALTLDSAREREQRRLKALLKKGRTR